MLETLHQWYLRSNTGNESFSEVFSVALLLALFVSAIITGRVIASMLRYVTRRVGMRADKTEDLAAVNRLRRIETIIVLSIAMLRIILAVVALYAWWHITMPNLRPSTLIGAGALTAILIGSMAGPILRDIGAGAVMMTEHWYGVGDHIKVEPFDTLQGVVERVTLRSTRIRGLNGEIIWVNNQNIAAVRLAPRGIRTIAIELIVSDRAGGRDLIELTSQRLPDAPLMIISELTVMTEKELGNDLWYVTAIGETAPGREWLLEEYAINIIKELDGKARRSVLLHGPIARHADGEAERHFARTIHNARKTRKPRAKKTSLKGKARPLRRKTPPKQ